MAPEDCQFIVDEVEEAGVDHVAKNKYGCRILQRLLERCPRQQVRGMLEAIIRDMPSFCVHPYANYIVQTILRHGSSGDRQRIVSVTLGEAEELCRAPHGCIVVLVAFETLHPDLQDALAKRLARKQGLLVNMACSKQGAALVQRLIHSLHERDRCQALSDFTAAAGTLGASEHGRRILEELGIPATRSAVGLASGCERRRLGGLTWVQARGNEDRVPALLQVFAPGIRGLRPLRAGVSMP
eukprot:CAMPEP_0170447782 /NCGR_PEP_ID=MMETSP0117_2-20130122/50356_1 /TAXON_ID=400756 /ORGANISM="Durinskia baltica, Strain CSIRO CS-38" /LENGTH=240 /DNA_ID=CAMNT_0010708903 /DNA_START=12 /DNA_END=732 /DNA_ORIENTATION=-